MYVKQFVTNTFFDKASKKFAEKGIGQYTDPGLITAFQEQLKAMAQARNYKEGERIIPGDLVELTGIVKSIIEDMAVGIAEERVTPEQSENIANGEKPELNGKLTPREKATYDAHASMMAVNDYLFAMAMKTLGSPDIPENFGNEMTDLIYKLAPSAELKLKEKDYAKNSVDKHYNDQRKKDAVKVQKNNRDLRKDIIEKKASPIGLSRYAAEYFALKRRQEGHNAIWRFFHKKENIARTKLLANMKALLEKTLGNGVDIDTLTPEKVATEYTTLLAKENFAKNTFAKRNMLQADNVCTEPTSTERADGAKEAVNSEVLDNDDLRVQIHFEKGTFQETVNVADTAKKDGNEAIDLSEPQIEENVLSANEIKI